MLHIGLNLFLYIGLSLMLHIDLNKNLPLQALSAHITLRYILVHNARQQSG
jgi:hypothetical protein